MKEEDDEYDEALRKKRELKEQEEAQRKELGLVERPEDSAGATDSVP